MKVNELIKKLQRAAPNAEVVMASDAEGNGFAQLADIQNEEAFPLYDEKPKPCVILWPSHEKLKA